MDEISLAILSAEMKEDCRVLCDAALLAQSRVGEETPSGIEAAAYQVTRFYNVLEQLATRVARAFENHIEDRQGWHTELIRRLSLNIPEVRPPFFPSEIIPDIRELRGFRHIFVHSYDLALDAKKVGELVGRTQQVAAKMPALCEAFVLKVRTNLSS